jgi:hypothetical protein
LNHDTTTSRPARPRQPQGRRVERRLHRHALRGTIALEQTPPELKRLFQEYEEVVEGQMFSLLDGIEAKISVIPFKVSFENGTEADVEDLQVFPSTEAVSFKTRQPVKSA